MAEMKNGLSFSSLWNKFDVVYERETSGRHDLKSFRHFLEERAKIEETYASSLIKLQAKEKGFEASGSHSKCWTDLKEVTKGLAEQHQELATKLNKEIGAALDACVKKLKTEKERMMAEHKALEKELARKQSNHDKALTRYRDAVKAAEIAAINKDKGGKENLAPPKQAALEEKEKAAFDKVDKSHIEYQTAVNELKALQTDWDAKLKEHLDAFEALERERLDTLTEQFKRSSEAHAALQAAISQLVISLNTGISDITPEADVHAFITTNMPDSQPPAHVTYEPIVSEIINHARGGGANSSAFIRRDSRENSNYGAAVAAPPKAYEAKVVAQPPAPKAAVVVPAAPMDNMQSFSDAVNKQPQGQFAIALYAFDATEDSDLPFKVDDRIKILDTSDKDWWRGEVRGRQGIFPSNYVKLLGAEDGGVAAASSADSMQAAPRSMDARAQALYDFIGQGNDELSFKEGEILSVTGELNQWYLGKSADGTRVGIFPSNYVKIL